MIKQQVKVSNSDKDILGKIFSQEGLYQNILQWKSDYNTPYYLGEYDKQKKVMSLKYITREYIQYGKFHQIFDKENVQSFKLVGELVSFLESNLEEEMDSNLSSQVKVLEQFYNHLHKWYGESQVPEKYNTQIIVHGYFSLVSLSKGILTLPSDVEMIGEYEGNDDPGRSVYTPASVVFYYGEFKYEISFLYREKYRYGLDPKSSLYLWDYYYPERSILLGTDVYDWQGCLPNWVKQR